MCTEYGQGDSVLDRGHEIRGPARVVALMGLSYALDQHRAAVLVLLGHGQRRHGRRVQRLAVLQPTDAERRVSLGYETLPADATSNVVTVAYRERMDVRRFCKRYTAAATSAIRPFINPSGDNSHRVVSPPTANRRDGRFFDFFFLWLFDERRLLTSVKTGRREQSL